MNAEKSGLMSTLFDVGGIFGGIAAGLISDHIGGRATTCGIMLIFGSLMVRAILCFVDDMRQSSDSPDVRLW